MEFSHEVTQILQAYVYLYVDPRDSEIFYIGKGRGNRAFEHLNESSDKKKVARIKSIQAALLEPKIELLRYGLTDKEAELVEATAIDLLMDRGLTNEMRGRESLDFGRIPVSEIAAIYSAPPVTISHRVMLIKINRLFRYSMTPDELYHATRGVWPVGKDRDAAEYAFAVYRGVVREVYKIGQWDRAGTTLKANRDDVTDPKYSKRWEFEGEIAENTIRDKYLGKNVRAYIPDGARFPIKYVNIKV